MVDMRVTGGMEVRGLDAPSAHHERVGGRGAGVDPDALALQVLVNGLSAVLTPEARILVATERRHEADRAVGIDPDHAGLELLRNANAASDAARPDARAETELHG